MKKISTVILMLSLLTSSALYASSSETKKVNDHIGDHMHMGKMINHMNKDGKINKEIK